MLRKFIISSTVFVVALAILAVSVFQSSSLSYALSVASPTPKSTLLKKSPEVEYLLTYPGDVAPDSPLWSFKALRDKLLYTLTPNPLKKAELALLFSDKRLLLSKSLFESKKPDIALSTLSKGEKYLEIASAQAELANKKGINTKDFLIKLATASLKHRQVIEEMLLIIPEDGKPLAIKSEDYSKESYKYARDGLNSMGVASPINPFDGNK